MKEVMIDLGKEIAPCIATRDSIKDLAKKIESYDKVILDFKNVEFISRSVAHELVKLAKERNIEFRNMNQFTKILLATVARQLNESRKGSNNYELKVELFKECESSGNMGA